VAQCANLFFRCSQHIPAMKQHGIRRILMISALGARDTRADVGWFARNVLFRLLLRHEVADKETMEVLLLGTDLEWTIVRVGILAMAPHAGGFAPRTFDPFGGWGRIVRSDFADFMLAQIENEFWKWRKPVLVY
jgi:hypothetical protein